MKIKKGTRVFNMYRGRGTVTKMLNKDGTDYAAKVKWDDKNTPEDEAFLPELDILKKGNSGK